MYVSVIIITVDVIRLALDVACFALDPSFCRADIEFGFFYCSYTTYIFYTSRRLPSRIEKRLYPERIMPRTSLWLQYICSNFVLSTVPLFYCCIDPWLKLSPISEIAPHLYVDTNNLWLSFSVHWTHLAYLSLQCPSFANTGILHFSLKCLLIHYRRVLPSNAFIIIPPVILRGNIYCEDTELHVVFDLAATYAARYV